MALVLFQEKSKSKDHWFKKSNQRFKWVCQTKGNTIYKRNEKKLLILKNHRDDIRIPIGKRHKIKVIPFLGL